MTDAQFMELIQQVVWLILLIGAPVLLSSMVVGIGISIFQAVTQIQESTLTFVPKILVSLLVFVFTGPWVMDILITYSSDLFNNLPQYIAHR